MNKIALLSLATAVPPFSLAQNQIADALIQKMPLSPLEASKLKKIFLQSRVDKRHFAAEHFREGGLSGLYAPPFPEKLPGSKKRNEIYKCAAPPLAHAAAKKALDQWGGSPKEITHIISVSCTGFMAPGIEFLLMDSLGLPKTVSRTGINFMGCFGAFQGLKTAGAFARENPKHRVLVVCTELCSLHFQGQITPDSLISNCIFSDGAAAFVMGGEARSFEKILWTLEKYASLAFDDSTQEMTWEPGDDGYEMRLTRKVPPAISERIGAFVEEFTQEKNVDWLIHPGGKAILKGIGEALKLEESQLGPSWEILKNYGNMSSATFLFVLEEALKKGNLKEQGIGIAFGPGLSMEGVLLKRA